MMRRLAGLGLAAGVALAAAACMPPDDQRTDSIEPGVSGRADLSPETLAQIDSGNVAYRRGDYDAAAELFGEVTRSAPDDPTGWFGLYMAYTALGDTQAADSALAQARELAPGASLIRLPEGDEAGAAPDTAGGGGDGS